MGLGLRGEGLGRGIWRDLDGDTQGTFLGETVRGEVVTGASGETYRGRVTVGTGPCLRGQTDRNGPSGPMTPGCARLRTGLGTGTDSLESSILETLGSLDSGTGLGTSESFRLDASDSLDSFRPNPLDSGEALSDVEGL